MDLRTTGMEFASEMVVKADPDGDERRRGAHDAGPRRPLAPAALAALSRRLATFAVYGPVEPRLAVPVPWPVADRLGARARRAPISHPLYVGGVRFSVDTLIYCVTMIEIGFQAVLVRAPVEDLRHPGKPVSQAPARPSLFDRAFTGARHCARRRAAGDGGVSARRRPADLGGARNSAAPGREGDPRRHPSSLSLSLGFEIILSSSHAELFEARTSEPSPGPSPTAATGRIPLGLNPARRKPGSRRRAGDEWVERRFARRDDRPPARLARLPGRDVDAHGTQAPVGAARTERGESLLTDIPQMAVDPSPRCDFLAGARQIRAYRRTIRPGTDDGDLLVGHFRASPASPRCATPSRAENEEIEAAATVGVRRFVLLPDLRDERHRAMVVPSDVDDDVEVLHDRLTANAAL